MRKSYFTMLLSVGVALGSLSSCNRASYVFTPSSSAYLGSTAHSTPVAAAPKPELSASSETATPSALASPAKVAATALARPHTPTVARTASTTTTTATQVASTPAAPAFTKAERKELKQVLRQAAQQQKKGVAPTGTSAEGKSQIVAALLAFFLGSFGAHRFYLGYIGRGILYLGLLLTSFLILPGIALLVLVVIDFVRILTGSLKPKDGDYATKL